MVAQAAAKAADLGSRVRFLMADIASFDDEDGFDLIVMLNMPPFFDRVVALLRPGGVVVNASSYGARTPFFAPPGLLQRGFERRGLRTLAAKQVGPGTELGRFIDGADPEERGQLVVIYPPGRGTYPRSSAVPARYRDWLREEVGPGHGHDEVDQLLAPITRPPAVAAS